jgi:hypothetical protein
MARRIHAVRLTLVFIAALCAGSAFAQNPSATEEVRIPKENCGIVATTRKFVFKHFGSALDDAATLEFTSDGGFVIYDEDGDNHNWELDANGLVLTYRTLTRPMRGYTNYNLDASPRQTSGTNANVGPKDWTIGFASVLHSIVNMELTAITTKDQAAQLKTALNCAHKIVVNAAARGQERLLEGKTNTRY